MERFQIPAAGAIIIKDINGVRHILTQVRHKAGCSDENGLIEIPGGKIREFENVFDTLKREVKEETGLDIIEILGQDSACAHESNSYKTVNFSPFFCTQNLAENYPVMVFVFICRAAGEMLESSDEARNFKWMPVGKMKKMLDENPGVFYPMHSGALIKYCMCYDGKEI